MIRSSHYPSGEDAASATRIERRLASARRVLYDELAWINSLRLFLPRLLEHLAMQLREKAHLMTGSEIERTLVHLAHEIVEKTEELKELALVGVRRRGVYLAERLARKIQEMTSWAAPVGSLDIQLYRDDVSSPHSKPVALPSQIRFPVNGKDILLVDDVLYTGRTCRAAMEALFDHGRPRRVRLCVLIDRGRRELPIEATFVGKRIAADPQEVIEVKLREEDEIEKVLVLEKVAARTAS